MIPALTGILAPHGLATSFESIATVTVGAGGSASVSFTSIPSTYQHLQLRYIARDTGTGGGGDNLAIRANSDSGTNYTYHVLYGNGSAPGASGNTSRTYSYTGLVSNGGNTASVFTAGVVDILDYSSSGSKYKTFRSLSGYDANGSGIVAMESCVWMNTNAITSLDITCTNGNYVQFSSFALYGVKA
mgnify:CR=1 FL=1